MILLSEYKLQELLQAIREIEGKDYVRAMGLMLGGLNGVSELDERDLHTYGKALDALEDLHDYASTSRPRRSERIRECACQQAAAWRAARKVYVQWRMDVGLPVRRLDLDQA